MCTFWSFLCIIVSITWQKFPRKNCPDVRGMCYVLRWHGKVPALLIHYEDGGSLCLFFWQQNPEELTNRPPLSLASWALSLSEHSVTLRMLFLFFPWDMPFPSSSSLLAALPGSGVHNHSPVWGWQAPTAIRLQPNIPGVHWRPLNWPPRLVLRSCPAPKLEAFDADKSSWNSTSWHPARPSSL